MSGDLRTVPQPFTLEALSKAFVDAGGSGGEAATSYLAQAYEDYAGDETPDLDLTAFAHLLVEVWSGVEARPAGGEAVITVRGLTGYDVVTILQDDLYLATYGQSLLYAGITTAVCLFIGYPFAYFMARSPATVQPLLLMGVMLPFWTSFLLRVYA